MIMPIALFKSFFKQTDDRAAALCFRVTHMKWISIAPFSAVSWETVLPRWTKSSKRKKCPYPPVVFMWKKLLSTHTVCRRKWCWVGDWLHFFTGIDFHCTLWHFGHDNPFSLSLLFGNWVAERFPTMPRYRNLIGPWQREILQGAFEDYLRRTGIFVPVGSGKAT